MKNEKKKQSPERKRDAKSDPVIRYIIILGGIILALGLISFFFNVLGRWFFSSAILSVLSIGGFLWGVRLTREDDQSSRIFGGTIIFLSAILLGLDVLSVNNMFGKAIHSTTTLLFIITAAYGVTAYAFTESLILILALLSLFASLAYAGGGFWGFLPFFKGGTNSHTYIALASPFVIAAGFLHQLVIDRRFSRFLSFDRVYFFMGFVFLNVSLWMLSLFGRHPNLFDRSGVDSTEKVIFTVLFFIANIAAVVFGALKKDRTYITFGAIFLTVNVLTRFGDVFFEGLGGSVVFIIAGAILIVLGIFLERALRKL